MTKEAGKFFADYFHIKESEAVDCNHMTLDCMDEFDKQEAIEFAEWILSKRYVPEISAGDLYNEFLKQKQK